MSRLAPPPPPLLPARHECVEFDCGAKKLLVVSVLEAASPLTRYLIPESSETKSTFHTFVATCHKTVIR